MKVCSTCGESKELSEFQRRSAPRIDHSSQCKTCQYAYQKQRKINDPDFNRKHAEYTSSRNHETRKWLAGIKEENPCVDCGNYFPFYAMQYDHKEEFEKVADVSKMVGQGRRREAILDEIAKCDLVCANCHAGRSYRQNLTKYGKEAINV